MFSKIINWFIPGKYTFNPDTYRSVRTLVSVIIITSLFSINYLVISVLLDFREGIYAMIFNAVGFVILPFIFRSGLSRTATAHLYTFIGTIGVFISAFYTGGPNSTTLLWLILLPCIMLLISDLQSGIIWTAISMICVLVLYIMKYNGYLFPNHIEQGFRFTKELTDIEGLILILFVITTVFEQEKKHMLKKLDQKNKVIEEEKKKSEALLLNILPAEISNELKETGKTKAYSYEVATVMFADFVDFTRIGERLSPEELVFAIGEYFETFDHVTEKYGIEKIKTVGDAYICAAGLPIPSTDNALIMIKAALDFLSSLQSLNERRQTLGEVAFNLRIGINTGPLVAGVVGIKKFAYDIWGDTVNTAARLQENGSPNRINISETTYELVKHRFNCTYRGKIEAKNKGEIDMYFVEGVKTKVKA